MKGVGYFEGVRLIELAQIETEIAQSTFHTHYKFRLNFRYRIASCNVKNTLSSLFVSRSFLRKEDTISLSTLFLPIYVRL